MKWIFRSISCVLLSCVLGSSSAGVYSTAVLTDTDRDTQQGGKQTSEGLAKQQGKGSAVLTDGSKADTNLSDWTLRGRGSLEDTDEGLHLTSDEGENVMAVSATRADNFIYEADVKIQNMKADASLIFRSNDTGWSSYMLQVVPEAGVIRLRDASGQTREH